MYSSLRSWMEMLAREQELVVIETPVDPHLEIAEIHRRVIAEQGPALLFLNVQGSRFPVVTNLLGTERRMSLAFGPKPEELVKNLVGAVDELLPLGLSSLWAQRSLLAPLLKLGTKKVSAQQAPVMETTMDPVDLYALPFLTSWPEDGGPFLTLPYVYTEPPGGGAHNLGMYRMQRYNATTTGMHWQIQKGGGFHYFQAEAANQSLPVSVFLGGPPALLAAAVAPLPEAVPELLLASFLLGQKLPVTHSQNHPYPCPAEAEFLLQGSVAPHLRQEEGPFGDHYGFYSLAHPFPVLQVQAIHHRKDAIYPATIVGKPRQEDFYLGEYLQRLLAPLFPKVMPGVRDLWTFAEGGFHTLAAAVVHERYAREAVVHALRILGEGQLSLTKCLLVTDRPIELRNIKACLTTILERFQPAQDLIILPQTSADTLDYTGGKLHRGSKMILLGLGSEPCRSLPTQLSQTPLPEMPGVRKIEVFSPGVLVLHGQAYRQEPEQAAQLLKQYGSKLKLWPLIILADDPALAQDDTAFLWGVFTRFDPNRDVYVQHGVERHHLLYELPILIDARQKPNYPPEVTSDEAVARQVTERWSSYFPKATAPGG